MESEESADIGSVSKGKHGELTIIAKLLLRGLSVYLPVVDAGIDFLVGIGKGNYKEVQVKSREGDPTFSVKNFVPRDNFYIICYLRGKHDEDDFWIVPSKVFKEKGRLSKVGKKEVIQLHIREGSQAYNELAVYHGTWGILTQGAAPDVRRSVEQASKRAEIGEHFTQPYFEREILRLLSTQSKPVKTLTILDLLRENLGQRFTKADLQKTKRGLPRWENNVRFALYQRLKKSGLVHQAGRSEWQITAKGIQGADMLKEIQEDSINEVS